MNQVKKIVAPNAGKDAKWFQTVYEGVTLRTTASDHAEAEKKLFKMKADLNVKEEKPTTEETN